MGWAVPWPGASSATVCCARAGRAAMGWWRGTAWSCSKSHVRCCRACLKRRVQVGVDGQRRWRCQSYHRVVLSVVVSGPLPVPLALRFRQPGESAVAWAAALVEELVRSLGRRSFDIVVADAPYLQTPFTRRLERLGLDWVLTLEDQR